MVASTQGERVFTLFNYTLLTLIGLSMLLPFLFVLSSSVTPEKEILSKGMVLLPSTGLSLKSFQFILREGTGIPRAYAVTVFVTAAGTVLSLLATAMLAYGLTKRDLPGRKLMTFAILFTMLFGGGLIPTYMVVKSVGLINSIWALIIPGLISVWNMLVLMSFFESLPDSLEEAAIMDGCHDLSIFARIVLPLSLPALASIGLFYAVAYWNAWFNAVIYINDKSLWPLQLILRQVLTVLDFNVVGGSSYLDDVHMVPPPSLSVKSATIAITTLPILFLYPFLQKYFVKGVMIGAVKG